MKFAYTSLGGSKQHPFLAKLFVASVDTKNRA